MFNRHGDAFDVGETMAAATLENVMEATRQVYERLVAPHVHQRW